MRIQTLARELALQALYQCDLLDRCRGEDLRAFCAAHGTAKVSDLAGSLAEGCVEHLPELDEVIRQTAEHWEMKRMAVSDRNILRLGVFELLFRKETPPKVAINEAIELAKKYSTENSPTFVNGVLDRVYTTHAAKAGAPAPEESAERPDLPQIEPDPEARADLHVHSTASDGSVPPEELPAMAARAGLSALALTDHDSVEGVTAAREAAEAAGILLVPGVELTGYAPLADDRFVELHIAGLFVDPDSDLLADRLRELREARVERVRAMTQKLRELGIGIEADDVLQRAPGAAVGRVHVAQEMVEKGYCKDMVEAFRRHIGDGCPAYVPKERMTPAQTIELVKAAGGCAALCHPGLDRDVEARIEELVECGLDALEVHYPGHTPQDEKRLLDTARRLGLAVTGGSDFHGSAKPDIHLGQEAVSFVELRELARRASLPV